MNTECNNYKQELNEGTTICSLCNELTELFETKVNSKLKLTAIVAGITSIVLFMWAWGIPFWASFAIAPASVVVGFISKSKAAIITTNLSLVAMVGLIIHFFVL
jgi:hypothetical protein